MTARYRVNRNERGQDVVHDEHPLEECNIDDARDRDWWDVDVAREKVGAGEARFCHHCLADGIPE